MGAAGEPAEPRPTKGLSAWGARTMWRTVYFWLGLLLARYLFRRRIVQIDLDRLRNAGM